MTEPTPLTQEERAGVQHGHVPYTNLPNTHPLCHACSAYWPCPMARYEATVATFEAALAAAVELIPLVRRGMGQGHQRYRTAVRLIQEAKSDPAFEPESWH